MAELVRPGEDRMLDATVVGHKFARQERLRRAGLPVPEFWCVPVDAFDAALRDLPDDPPGDGDGDGDGGAEVAEWAAAAADRLAAAQLPPALSAAVLAAVGCLVGDGGLVAVRACTVAGAGGAGEDGATDAFAGVTDSFLYVPAGDVLRRVRECWASGLRPRSVRYRAHRGLAPAAARVAVGIQPMVPGARSFVAFSRDPRTGADCCVVAAAHGIGEGVVQERADVDHFFLAATGEISRELVVKHRMVCQAAAGEGVEERPVPPELAEPPVLADDEVRRVAELAARAEAFFGSPQDIEGTITADGAIHLLQARPVVATVPPVAAPRVKWSNHNVTESFPGVSGALTYSQARVFYRSTFRDGYRRMGVPERRLRSVDHHLQRMIGVLDGRVYYRLDAWFALHPQVPGFALIQPWWEQAMGLDAPRRRPPAAQIGRALVAAPAMVVRLVLLPGRTRRFLRWWDALVERSAGIDTWSAEQLIAFYRRLWAEVAHRWGVTLVNSFFLLWCSAILSTLVRRWVSGEAQRVLGGLVTGGRENRSVLAVRSAIGLAELVGRDESLADRVVRCGPDLPGGPAGEAAEIWRDIVDGRYGAELAAAAAEHLRRYGDRALHDLKLEEPSPRQRPGMLVAMIQPMVRAGLTVAGSRAAERASRAEAEQDLRRLGCGPVRRLAIRGLAAVMRWFVKTREDTRYCRSQLFGLTRQVLWRLGDLLTGAGRLDQPADVRDLTVEEVLGAFDGTLVETDLRAVVARRRQQREAAAGRPGFDDRLSTPRDLPVAGGLPARRHPAQAAAVAGDLRGLPSSRGVVRGQARVVLDPSVPPESCRDRIIVARETDPGWLFLMMAARGMVVERGTLLSHTAITGRLLGIPTVVAVPGATSLIGDGAWVEVDGGAGTVRVL